MIGEVFQENTSFFLLWDKYCPVWTEYIPISIVIFSNLPYNQLIVIRVLESENVYTEGGKYVEELLCQFKRLAPDLTEEMVRRYRILKAIQLLQPAGRRSVAAAIGMPERMVRSEIDKLVTRKLISVSKIGMTITEEGADVLQNLAPMFVVLTGISAMEKELAERLGVEQVLIAPGDCDRDPNVKREMGRLAARAMLAVTDENDIIAVTGGSSLTAFVDEMPQFPERKAKMVLPARGSMGRRSELQAETLAIRLAGRLCAEYRMLHLPDSLSSAALEELKHDPEIAETMQEMAKVSMLLFGIGRGLEMAKKRHMSERSYQQLEENHTVAEACGSYFNAAGEVVHVSRSIGIDFDEISRIEHIIAIAGGESKADCICAVAARMRRGILVMDEGAAKYILTKNK